MLALVLAARPQRWCRCLPLANCTNIGVAAQERGFEQACGPSRSVPKRPRNHWRDAPKADVGGGGGDGQQRRSLLRRDGEEKRGARPAHGGHLPLASSLPGQPVDHLTKVLPVGKERWSSPPPNGLFGGGSTAVDDRVGLVLVTPPTSSPKFGPRPLSKPPRDAAFLFSVYVLFLLVRVAKRNA